MKTCVRCGSIFNRIDNFKRHLSRKNICEIKYLDVLPEEILDNYEELYKHYLINKLNQNIAESSQEGSQNIVENNQHELELFCIYCGKEYKHKSSYYRHIKNRCKVKKQEEKQEEKNKLMDEFLATKYTLLKIEYDKKYQENEEIKLQLEKKIEDLQMSMQEQNISNNGQNTDSISQDNSQNFNININNFGEEDLSKMTASDWESIILYQFDMIEELIKYIHINKEENRNIYIPSTKEKFALIFEKQNWNLINKNPFFKKLIFNKSEHLHDAIDKYGNDIKKITKKRARNFINLCSSDKEEIKKLTDNINMLFVNNNQLIKNTYEKNYNKKIKSR